MIVTVHCVPRIYGGTVKCFYKGKYNVWKTLTIYRADPHKFRLAM